MAEMKKIYSFSLWRRREWTESLSMTLYICCYPARGLLPLKDGFQIVSLYPNKDQWHICFPYGAMLGVFQWQTENCLHQDYLGPDWLLQQVQVVLTNSTTGSATTFPNAHLFCALTHSMPKRKETFLLNTRFIFGKLAKQGSLKYHHFIPQCHSIGLW